MQSIFCVWILFLSFPLSSFDLFVTDPRSMLYWFASSPPMTPTLCPPVPPSSWTLQKWDATSRVRNKPSARNGLLMERKGDDSGRQQLGGGGGGSSNQNVVGSQCFCVKEGSWDKWGGAGVTANTPSCVISAQGGKATFHVSSVLWV